eukprot:GILK01005444.1.p1 GENE.GILK01005444.1~~GILK01005444.1.p1  ORF type:complete len:320 (-),score=53.72 GILK01005444.1:236-1195(-)
MAALSEGEAAVYDRQIRLWGVEAQRRMMNSRVLLIGFRGLNAEVCKNLVLAGIGVTIADSKNVEATDLSTNFFVEASHIGQNRATASVTAVRALNPLVEVNTIEEDVTQRDAAFFKQFTVICATDLLLEQQMALNNKCRDAQVPFMCGNVFGYYGFMFADLLTHSYFTEKKNADGVVEQEQKRMNFLSLRDSFDAPWTNLKRVSKLFYAIHAFLGYSQSLNQWPIPGDQQHADQFLTHARTKFASVSNVPATVTDDLLRMLGRVSIAELSPVCAVLGGEMAQEVIKVISGKDAPIQNWFFYDGLEGSGVIECIPPAIKS